MGLLGGWWMVTFIAVAAGFLIREVFKAMRGEVDLTARQKVVRTFGGAFLMGVLLMIAFAPRVLHNRPSGYGLTYWNVCFVLALLMLLMAIMDFGELVRTFQKDRKDIRRRTIQREDIERILREDEERKRRDG